MVLVCTNCREGTGKVHDVSLTHQIPCKIGHGHVHYSAKCKFCSKEQTIEIIPDSIKPYVKGDPLTKVVVFECRGVEPSQFEPRDGWIAKAENSSLIFNDIDLKEGDWAEYDEKAQEPVGIDSIESNFVRS
ncbi:UPF0587 protein GA18326 [Gryllus bimaculatus]|nr:UPF0587 protein GA18326 [Gryllus bimaculatus]